MKKKFLAIFATVFVATYIVAIMVARILKEEKCK